MELAQSRCDIANIIGDIGHPNREAMHWQIKLDTFLFIPSYWLLYALLGVLMIKRGMTWGMWFGIAAIICGTVAAGFDFVENAGIREALKSGLDIITDQTAKHIRYPSLIKWGFSFATVGLLSPLFFTLNRAESECASRFGLLLGCLYAAASLIGFVSLSYNPVMPIAVLLIFGGLLYLIPLCFFCWKAFSRL
jgi:threonine/homoserine efflux transporter RhtA